MLKRLSIGLAGLVLIAGVALWHGKRMPGGQASNAPALIDRYCTSCHNDIDRLGDLALDELDAGDPAAAADSWERVVRKLRTGLMPPAGEPRPDAATLDGLAAVLERRLDAAAELEPNPGAPALHRLNRTEYANAIRDLLAVQVDVSTLLPGDDAADGFDNIAGVLTVSPSLIEAYVSAAMKISRRAVGDLTMLPKTVVYRAPAGLQQGAHFEGLPLGTRGGMIVTHDFPLDAEYAFSIVAGGGGRGFGGGGPTGQFDLVLNFDGSPVPVDNPRRFRMRMPAGPVEIAAAIVDRSRADGVTDYHATESRPTGVTQIQIDGPFETSGAGDTPSRRQIFSCYPASTAEESPCAREILSRLASLAYRQLLGPQDPEVELLVGFYEHDRADHGFDAGIQRALAMMLVNPRFLFRAEQEPEAAAPGEAYRVADYDLAARLSFFLWSSIPDRELLELASQNALRDPAVLHRQVARMLADPRAEALVDNFAGQWLYLRALADVEPETPAWDENLRAAFRQETELLFRTIVNDDRPIVDLIDADYTFVNERLARHYGIEGIRGSYFRRISLPPDSPRRGILGQGSLLTVTSVANRTSPVVRGAWILENLFGAPPPSPPPGVESNLDDAAAAAVSSLRERLQQHRRNPTCASCHSIMDPVGLALENFDLIGGWRTEDSGQPIDATGVLTDGTPITGPLDLRDALVAHTDSFVTVATEKLMTYALGRSVEYYDMPAVRRIVRDAASDDYRFSALVNGIVTSVPFQMRIRAPSEGSAE